MVPGQHQDREREVLAALLTHNHHLIRDGQILLADKGFAGKQFKRFTTSMGLRPLGLSVRRLIRSGHRTRVAGRWTAESGRDDGTRGRFPGTCCSQRCFRPSYVRAAGGHDLG